MSQSNETSTPSREYPSDHSLFRQLFDLMPQLGWTARPDGYIDFYNRAWYEYTGTTFEEMEGWGWEKVHDPAVLPAVIERWQHSLSTGEVFEMKFPLRGKDGVFRWFLTRINPVRDHNGKLIRWVGINSNVQSEFDLEQQVAQRTSELQESKALVEEILETISEATIVADASGRITYLNKAARELHGETQLPSLLNQAPQTYKLYSTDGTTLLPVNELPLIKALNGADVDDQEMIIEAADSRMIFASASARAFKAGDNTVKGAVVTLRDITARKQDERLLAEARDEAIRANEAKSRFLATISHEVRTPLAGVIGMVELLAATSTDDEIKFMAGCALDSSRQLLRILNDLLDASKLQAGKVVLEMRKFPLRALIGDVVQLAHSEADRKNIELKSSFEPDVPEWATGDELRVKQILLNLVFNAIKFTDTGSVSLCAKVAANVPDGFKVRFNIVDTGIGIASDKLPALFEPFVQADDSTTRVYGGTGLGLSICKSLIKMMHGEIGVASTVGQGSTFWVEIPLGSA